MENLNTIYNHVRIADPVINNTTEINNSSLTFKSDLLTIPLQTIYSNTGITTPLSSISFVELAIIRDATSALALPIPNDGITLKVVDNIEIADQENPIGATSTKYGYNTVLISDDLTLTGPTIFNNLITGSISGNSATSTTTSSAPDIALSANVPLLNLVNVFSQENTFNNIVTNTKCVFSNILKNILVNCNNLPILFTTGQDNIIMGNDSGVALTTGNSNILLGRNSGASLITGAGNVSIGIGSYSGTNDNSSNVSIGTQCGHNYLTLNNNNVSIGNRSAYNGVSVLLGASNCCFIGANTTTNSSITTYNKSVCIGEGSQITASNQIILGTATETTSILGSLSVGTLLQVSAALGIDAGTTNIHTNGITSTTNLTVDSITTTVTNTIVAGVLNVALGAYAIGRSQFVTMDQNIITIVPSAGVVGGVFKLWLTVDANPRTFFKACGVINNLAGDTVMGANSIWLIEIFKRSTVDWRIRLTNFT